ncbi:VUT family protein [Mesorhizobium sp.]|uniref:VUT family protein n=1 Tax=Mesorhizobium sp. TaxID=1871066 RepID=UPI000FE8ECAB|nr:VUT family protein [Mesorhizobium sp.]RWO20628.1 MAG: VUT family protein [Mesorhizobium sp.]
MLKYLLLAAFAATIPAANWLIGNVGTECIPNGPCLLPVGFGLMAPSGVFMVGLALVLRDTIQKNLGRRWSLAAIGVGTTLSFIVNPYLALASAAAFLASELVDFFVYTRSVGEGGQWYTTGEGSAFYHETGHAVLLSGLAGLAVDSVLFLYLAFGSLDHVGGQLVGKLWMVLAATAIITFMETRRWNAAVEEHGIGDRW